MWVFAGNAKDPDSSRRVRFHEINRREWIKNSAGRTESIKDTNRDDKSERLALALALPFGAPDLRGALHRFH
jgi:hypothetical protein